MSSTPAALAEARGLFERWLRAQDVPSELSDDLVVVVSELGANALAAARRPAARISVRSWREEDVLVLEVENAPASIPGGVVIHTDSDPLRGNGQGLLIVSAYTDSVEVIPPHGDSGLVVRCRKQLEAA